MFLHLGSNYMIPKDKVIAILDIETTASSTISRNFLNNILKGNKTYKISEDGKEKSVIICDDSVYLSPISSVTLLKRSSNSEQFYMI